jgi:hypothetical protein
MCVVSYGHLSGGNEHRNNGSGGTHLALLGSVRPFRALVAWSVVAVLVVSVAPVWLGVPLGLIAAGIAARIGWTLRQQAQLAKRHRRHRTPPDWPLVFPMNVPPESRNISPEAPAGSADASDPDTTAHETSSATDPQQVRDPRATTDPHR